MFVEGEGDVDGGLVIEFRNGDAGLVTMPVENLVVVELLN